MKSSAFTQLSRILLISFSVGFILTFNNIDIYCQTIGVINSILLCYNLFSREAQPYSLHKVVNIFLLVFFVWANLSQFNERSIVTSLNINFSGDNYFHFQTIVLIITLLYNYGYSYFFKTIICNRSNNFISRQFVVDSNRLLIISFIGLCGVLAYFASNPILMFVRGTEDAVFLSLASSQLSGLLFDKTLRCFPVCCMIIALLSRQVSKFKLFVLFLFMLLAVFPSALPRNTVAMYWMPILIICFRYIQKPHIVSWILITALFLIFPLLDIFRYYSGSINSNININLDYLNTMNFDSSQEFMVVIQRDIVTYGYQLLGPIFFFVPRTVWPEKPIGSGAFVAGFDGVFGNISMPWWGEGYINFGYFGVVFFTIVLSYISATMDKRYWVNNSTTQFGLSSGLFLLLLSGTMFILRGDLLSSFAYTFGTFVSYYIVFKVCTRIVSQ